jgi:hypothetical protein
MAPAVCVLLLAFTATASAFNLGGAKILAPARSPARAATFLDETMFERALEVRFAPSSALRAPGVTRQLGPSPALAAPPSSRATPALRYAGHARGGGGREPVAL